MEVREGKEMFVNGTPLIYKKSSTEVREQILQKSNRKDQLIIRNKKMNEQINKYKQKPRNRRKSEERKKERKIERK